MKRSDAGLFFLTFCFLLSAWTGFWSVHGDASDSPRAVVRFEPGVFEALRMENRFLDRLQDPLLESDSRPDRLFEAVHRDLTRNLVLAAGSGFLLTIIPLTILAGIQRRWFYPFMKRMVFLPVSLYLLIHLMLSPKEVGALAGLPQSYLLLVPTLWKSLLLFLTTVGWMQTQNTDEDRDFLTHLKRERLDLRHLVTERLRPAAFELLTVTVAGAAITNVVLLPFFQLQLKFAGYFALLLIPGVLLLGTYYVYSYRHVAGLRGESTSWFVALSFLAFRMMRNLLYLAGLFGVVMLTLVVIIALIYGNLGLLTGAGIIHPSPGL